MPNPIKYVIIPDVHQDVEWVQLIIAKHGTDVGYRFLGDYYDWRDRKRSRTPWSAKRTTLYLDSLIDTIEDVEFLIGNHDQSYLALVGVRGRRAEVIQPFHPAYKWICSGYSRRTRDDVARYIQPRLKAKLKTIDLLTVGDSTYVLSHAGVGTGLFNEYSAPHYYNTGEELSLEEFVSIATKGAPTINSYTPEFWCGHVRGGDDPFSGLTWLDFRKDTYHVFDGVTQIVGHTRGTDVKYRPGAVCLDTGQKCYGVITSNGVLHVDEI